MSCVFRSSIRKIFGKFEREPFFSDSEAKACFPFHFSVLLAAMTRPNGSVYALEHEEKEYITARRVHVMCVCGASSAVLSSRNRRKYHLLQEKKGQRVKLVEILV